jgi:hypothetical protein
MKRVFGIAVLLILVALVSLRVEGRRNPTFLLQLAGSHNSIDPDNAVWKVGEPVRVIVIMINQTKRDVHYTLTNPGMDWEMDVRDSAGNPVGETDWFRQMKENRKSGSFIVARNFFGTLRPNQKAQDVIEVQMFYDLSRAGEYSIQVQRTFPDVAKDLIKSKRLILTITP